MQYFHRTSRFIFLGCLAVSLSCGISASHAQSSQSECSDNTADADNCLRLEQITILGTAISPDQVTGAAQVISHEQLEEFQQTDIVRALRRVPGVSLQIEDGYGLRPNISIRGTTTERSSRITLLEDNVLIAPAPYSAPSAYYFPTAGRIHSIEVLKGPAAITQGPYTVGGAINLTSTPIPVTRSGYAAVEAGSDNSWRFHGSYGDVTERTAWLVETHQWQADGYQSIDRSHSDTGLDKQDYLARMRFSSADDARRYQQLEIKLQYSRENSRQSYLGLSENDFNSDPFRRYGLSELDALDNQHEQIQIDYRVEVSPDINLTATIYNNRFNRNWFKTEGIDFDGSGNAQEFDRTSWNSVIRAINIDEPIHEQSPEQLASILAGADTAAGSIQLRNNAREYFSRGIQFRADVQFETGTAIHHLEAGIRYHQDEEDRLQLNSTYHQQNGKLILDDLGLLGNAGNQIQDAQAIALHVYDRIEWGRLTLAPGLRYEKIKQSRVRWETRDGYTLDPSARSIDNLRDSRSNASGVLIPGVGLLYSLNQSLNLVAGVHKGFTAPTNAPGVDEESSINYEFGFRFNNGWLQAEALAFYNDYDNLLGQCTSSSGADCEAGDAFNGDAVSIPGLEMMLSFDLAPDAAYSVPVSLSYTWMDAQFDSDIADTEFFGDVSAGDPVPYIPTQQLLAQIGVEIGDWAVFLSANYVDSVCTLASCGEFDRTGSALIMDLAAHYDLNSNFQVFAMVENLSDETSVWGRQPYGARPNKDRSTSIGLRFRF